MRNVQFDQFNLVEDERTEKLIRLLAKSWLPNEGNFKVWDFRKHDGGQISYLWSECGSDKVNTTFLTASQCKVIEKYKINRKRIIFKCQNKWFYCNNEDPIGTDWWVLIQWDNGLPITCLDYDEVVIEQNICSREFRARCGKRRENWFEISAELADKWIKQIKYENGD